MSRGRKGLALIATLIAITWAVHWLQSGWTLTLLLRCTQAQSGAMTVTMLDESGRPTQLREFDVQQACSQGWVALPGYRPSTPIFVRLKGAGDNAQLEVKPGENIHAERRGYSAVIRLTATPPALANDQI